jgi:hypothetical protein
MQVAGTSMMLSPALTIADTSAGRLPLGQAKRAIDSAVHTLSQRLRQLTDLSLGIISIQSFGAEARNTACFPPCPHLALGGTAHAKGVAIPRCVDPVCLQVRP